MFGLAASASGKEKKDDVFAEIRLGVSWVGVIVGPGPPTKPGGSEIGSFHPDPATRPSGESPN
ncbi:hypothetical protein GCM10009776_33430 [Microbacterium deminutum]|uniref:Uncharacterized protein n=1 Tax=Microbacterium deminutum TaxID=344164 RepID=A0ABP5CRD1_9MICO